MGFYSRIVPEYSFLDARGLGAYEGRGLAAANEVNGWKCYAETISLNLIFLSITRLICRKCRLRCASVNF